MLGDPKLLQAVLLGKEAVTCPRCKQPGNVCVRYSFGVYAGKMCEPCARKGYRDQCGLGPNGQGDPNDLDEPLDPEPYYGMEDDELL